TAPLKGAPAVASKLMALADNGAGLTVRPVEAPLTPKPVKPAPPLAPRYKALMVWLPVLRGVKLKVAWPLSSSGSAGLTGVPASKKVTVPACTGASLVTVAV